MPRSLTTTNTNQLTATLVRPVFLVSMQFANETVYAWTGVGPLAWQGLIFQGVGTLGNISPITEGSEVNAQGITLTLSGIPSNLLTDAESQVKGGQLCQVYLGFVDANGALVDNPIPAFIGLLDQPKFEIGTDTATISITAENRLTDLNRARGGRYTMQDQVARFPGDNSLQYVHFLQDERINWK